MPSGDEVSRVRLSNDPMEWSRFRLRGGSTEDASVPRKPPSASLLRLPMFTCFVVCLGLSDLSLVTLLDPIHLLLRVGPPRRVSNQDHPSHETYLHLCSRPGTSGGGIAEDPLRGTRSYHLDGTWVTELRLSVPEADERLLPIRIASGIKSVTVVTRGRASSRHQGARGLGRSGSLGSPRRHS